MANANETSPAHKGPLQRFRVHVTEKHFYHLDVLARSENEAAGIAEASWERWEDDEDGSADAVLIELVPADDDDFWPPEETCQACGRTLIPDEPSKCDDCRAA
jgi:hypothetical protein